MAKEPEIIIDDEFIEPYWNNKKTHKNFHRAVDVAQHIQFHFDGYFNRPWLNNNTNRSWFSVNPYFIRLIDSLRPSESAVIRQYRRDNYLPYTKIPCQKVVNSLKKITKSSDWRIDFSKSDVPSVLKDDQKLQTYIEDVLPKYGSLEQWAYQDGVRWMLIDPNAIWVVMPINWDYPANELCKPFPHIIESKHVLDYKEGKYVVFVSPYVNEYKDDKGNKKIGKIITVITPDTFYDFKEIGGKEWEVEEHDNIIGEIPCGYFGGEEKTADIWQPYFESYIMGMLPALDEVAIDSSDLRGEKLQHIGSTYWYIQGSVCDACKGSGVLPGGKQVVCPTCNGRGSMPFSPYRHLEVNLNNIETAGKNVPIPPMGIVEKDKAMITLMRNEIMIGINNAYEAVNMQPLSQDFHKAESGIAKGYNADETNNFVYNIAYNLVEKNVKPICYYINEIRYATLIKNKDARLKMLPNIPVPEQFDFLNNRDAEDNLLKVMGADVDQTIKEAAMFDFINSKYQNQPDVRDKLIVIFKHDSISGMNDADIQTNLTNDNITKVDVVLHYYIKSFVTDLLAKNNDFLKKDFVYQKKTLYDLANKKLEELQNQSSDAINKLANPVKLDADGNQVDEAGNLIYTVEQLKTMQQVKRQRRKGSSGLDNA